MTETTTPPSLGQRLNQNDSIFARNQQRYTTRTRKLHSGLGRIVDDPNVRGLSDAQLKGMALWICVECTDPDRLKEWEKIGEKAILEERPELAPDAAPISFVTPRRDPATGQRLRALGFKFDRVRQSWSGKVSLSAIEKFAAANGGTIYLVRPGEPDVKHESSATHGIDEATAAVETVLDGAPDGEEAHGTAPASKEEAETVSEAGGGGGGSRGAGVPAAAAPKPGPKRPVLTVKGARPSTGA